MYKYIWKLFNKGLIKYYISSQNNPLNFNELEYRFTDSNGKKYYGFSDKISMSNDRGQMLDTYITWLANGLTPESLNNLIDKAEKALEDGIVKMHNNQRPNAIKIGAILHEIKTRQDMIKPIELIYNILAVQLVREDEDPMLFSNKIQLEKVEQFTLEEKNNNNFFLRLKELRMLWSFQRMSETEYSQYLTQQMETYQKLKEKLAYL
jgi:hypothetical protein